MKTKVACEQTDCGVTGLFLAGSRGAVLGAAGREVRVVSAGDVPAERVSDGGAFAPAVGEAFAVSKPRVVKAAGDATNSWRSSRVLFECFAQLAEGGRAVRGGECGEKRLAYVGLEPVGVDVARGAPSEGRGGLLRRGSFAAAQGGDEFAGFVVADVATEEANHRSDSNRLGVGPTEDVGAP